MVMDLKTPNSDFRRRAIILAGGEGTRLREFTRNIAGFHVPKQFCPLLGEIPLLEETRRRISLSVASERISFVLNREHERFYSPLLASVSRHNLVVQPRNRGTAPAILYALLRIAQSDPQAPVFLTPSDHYVGDAIALMNYVDLAFDAIENWPGSVVLLGIAPDKPEVAYGWIEPGPTLNRGQPAIFPVRRFWEKPTCEVARNLMAKGCLWNSFMIVGRVATLVGLFMLGMPELYVSFSKIRKSLGTLFEEESIHRLYAELRPSDFSREVLQPCPANLNVLPINDVVWVDLGEPDRVARALDSVEQNRQRFDL